VDESALLEALQSGHVGGAALDVYSKEPPPPELEQLVRHPSVIATPHIAASTEEAQEKVARQVTEQVIRALKGEPVLTPVNALAIRMAGQREAQPFLKLAEHIGQVVSQLTAGGLKRVAVRSTGDVPRRYADVLTIAVVKGVLSRWVSEPVNLINASVLAEEVGLQIDEHRDTSRGDYTTLIEATLETDQETHVVAGTVFGEGDLRLVRVDGYNLEVRPEGHLLFYRNVDRPGMLASVGSILADAGINIAALALGRSGKGSMALTAVSVDDDIPPPVLQEIARIEGVEGVCVVNV
jgi:D-3-phosphoglycerate dehydrogenase / 2-oxoglutarate reductase